MKLHNDLIFYENKKLCETNKGSSEHELRYATVLYKIGAFKNFGTHTFM